jgi:hypothetical protein
MVREGFDFEKGFWGHVLLELLKCLPAALHGTFGSYHRYAFQEGSAEAVACLPVPRPVRFFTPLFSRVCSVVSTYSFCKQQSF